MKLTEAEKERIHAIGKRIQVLEIRKIALIERVGRIVGYENPKDFIGVLSGDGSDQYSMGSADPTCDLLEHAESERRRFLAEEIADLMDQNGLDDQDIREAREAGEARNKTPDDDPKTVKYLEKIREVFGSGDCENE